MKTIDKIIETEKKVTAKVTVKVTVNQKKIIEAISLGNRGIIYSQTIRISFILHNQMQ